MSSGILRWALSIRPPRPGAPGGGRRPAAVDVGADGWRFPLGKHRTNVRSPLRARVEASGARNVRTCPSVTERPCRAGLRAGLSATPGRGRTKLLPKPRVNGQNYGPIPSQLQARNRSPALGVMVWARALLGPHEPGTRSR